MTADRVWGPLAWRLLVAFVAVALSSVAGLTVAALVGTDQGLAAAQTADRQRAAVQVAQTASAAYTAAGGWADANLDPAVAVATGAGARLVVYDENGTVVSGQRGTGGMGGMGSSTGMMSPDSGRVTASVVAAGRTVGSVLLAFGTPVVPTARNVAWEWIGAAAGASLIVALALSWFVSRRIARPVARLARTARALSAGDHRARSGVRGPGELGELGIAFDTMADDLAGLEQARRRLTADVAHELRNPLAMLRAGLEELRDGLVAPDTGRLTLLHDQTLRLGRVVDDLAELAEAESAALSLRLADVDLAVLAREVLAAYDPVLRAAGVTARAELAEGVVVSADADRLHQALGNLLGNAARYCRPGDDVVLRVHAAAGPAVIEIADTGPGIPPDELPHVFDRLWRGQRGRAVAGTGIGLTVVRELVVAHGGTVHVERNAADGTTFLISLPHDTSQKRG